MRAGSIALVLLSLSLLGCGAEDEAPLIESLDNREYEIRISDTPVITREQVIKKYRDFLDYATGEPMYGNAIRRLADIELETAEQEHLNTGSERQLEITQRKMQAAIRMYETYLETYPHRENVDLILYQLAKAYDLTGDYLGTLNTLSRLVNNYPDSRHYIESQFRRGEMLFALGRYHDAERAYATITSQTEVSVFREKAMFKYGWAMFKQNKFTPALHAFIEIIDNKQGDGLVKETGFPKTLARTEKELLDDLFRVVSLSFSYLDGARGIKSYFDRHGHKQYEPLVYTQLAETYLSKERFTDAADTYLAFGQHYPASVLAPDMHQRAIAVYKKANLPSLQLASKESFVKRYSVFGQYWKTHDRQTQDKLKPLLQDHLKELAQHHHAVARKTKSRKNKSRHYSSAITWYKTYIKSFPKEKETAGVNFLLAETYNDTGHYDRAIAEFEKTAYSYPEHAKQAEAGYAALVAYAKLIKQRKKQKRKYAQVTRQNIDSALKFCQYFPEDRRTSSVLTHTSEQLFSIRDYPRAVQTAQTLVESPNKTEKQLTTAYTVIAHSQFELENYPAAEQAYLKILAMLPVKSKLRRPLQDKLAASIYKQGEKSKQQGQLAAAANHFMRLGAAVPFSSFRISAEYDAASIYIELQNWKQAENTLIKFRKRYPKAKRFKLGVAEKLALIYSKNGKPLKAASEMERLAVLPGKTTQYRQDMLWRAAGLYQDGGKHKTSSRLYKKYLKMFPNKYPESIEASYQLAEYYKKIKQPRKQVYWLKQTIKTERKAGKASTNRTRFLAAEASLALAYPLMTNYRKTALRIPLKKSLKRKKSLMEKSITAYQRALNYRVADVTTSATYHIAEIYHDFSRSLLKSQRPKGLSADELEQYDILLEEQAYPFEEKAIAIHSKNIKHTKDGLFDKWIQRSLTQLSKLVPIRYAKFEKGEPYAEQLH